jgi:hypothetical protein
MTEKLSSVGTSLTTVILHGMTSEKKLERPSKYIIKIDLFQKRDKETREMELEYLTFIGKNNFH